MDEQLAGLAAGHGVATSYVDADGQVRQVDAAVVRAVLDELEADGSSRPPEPLVFRAGERISEVVLTEHGRELPPDSPLPVGYHRAISTERTVIVAPDRLPDHPPVWGWMLQLYALHSADSWGIGDLGDLRRFAAWSGDEMGAGAILINPLHAITPTIPVQRSPYSPSSRSFANPLYLDISQLTTDPGLRRRIADLRPGQTDLIDYDAVWTAKHAALELLWPQVKYELPDDRQLREFATFCALTETHGPDWRNWPAELRHPRSATAPGDRVAFHGWLQHLCDVQLAAARAAGPALIHDLPVGVSPDGADAWALQDTLATNVRAGAPPDPFNRNGQDWNLPPWRPDRLAANGYAPWREMIGRAFRNADGLRIDHVAGLWRLWWIPPGEPPDRGTYVHYNSAAMLAVLSIEAARADGMVIGEDLGTVQGEVTETLHQRGMASSVVLWFANGGPRGWPENAMASISTHDLPTAAGFLAGEHVRVQAELGIRGPTPEQAAAERQRILDMVAAEGIVEDDPITALHALLARAPSRLLLASLTDALGELRQPNLPGTIDQYPNWRIPLPVPFERLVDDDRIRRRARPLRDARP
jgi:4-alpha-glucanotransferase